MNAHSVGNNCNQYIYLRSVCRLDRWWKVHLFCRIVRLSPSLSQLWLDRIVQSDIRYRMDVSAVVVLRVQWCRIPSCRLVISIKTHQFIAGFFTDLLHFLWNMKCVLTSRSVRWKDFLCLHEKLLSITVCPWGRVFLRNLRPHSAHSMMLDVLKEGNIMTQASAHS